MFMNSKNFKNMVRWISLDLVWKHFDALHWNLENHGKQIAFRLSIASPKYIMYVTWTLEGWIYVFYSYEYIIPKSLTVLHPGDKLTLSECIKE